MRIKTAQLRAQSEAELKSELDRVSDQLRKLRFDAASHKLKNVKALAEARKAKARLLTLLSEKQAH